jgi:hypothetical protein
MLVMFELRKCKEAKNETTSINHFFKKKYYFIGGMLCNAVKKSSHIINETLSETSINLSICVEHLNLNLFLNDAMHSIKKIVSGASDNNVTI